MPKRPSSTRAAAARLATGIYSGLVGDIGALLEQARHSSARAVNALMTATYWEIGRRIVEFEQGGAKRAEYGEELLKRLAGDLTARFGRGFSRRSLQDMRAFYHGFPPEQIWRTLSAKSALRSPSSAIAPIWQTLSAKSTLADNPAILPTLPGESGANIGPTVSGLSADREIVSILSIESGVPGKASTVSRDLSLGEISRAFPLPWSHYVLLIGRVRSPEAFGFYHAEALRGGWSVRQLQRQMDSQFYERTALSRDKAAMLTKGAKPQPGDTVTADDEIRHPLVLEFLGLRDEYSESDLEDALIRHLETFLLELGNDFAFVGRQRRLRIDDEWYRVDLLFFHRRLRCLVIVDLKLGRFTHADAGQMQLYLNYAREHWAQPGENPPVGIVLCSGKSDALVRYATEALPNQLLVREYLTALPDEKILAAELERTRRKLEKRVGSR